MTDIGFIAVLLAFVVSIYAAVAAVLGAREGFPELVHSARRGAYAVAGLLALAEAVLAFALLTDDFGLRYVYEHTSRDMAPAYKIAAIYSGNDGSLLFWAFVLAVLGAVAVYVGRRDSVLTPYMLATTSAVTAFFTLLVALIASPFERTAGAADGLGMNPMLENVGMLIHPPTLFLGYVGLTIPFALAVAALVTGRLGGEWLARARGWALFAWLMLGIGNVLGGQWAYVELGWGGYWAWDPVENASLMPWLIATAYLHAALVQKRRPIFKVWTMGLVAAAFLLCIFGTFITRSGVISSVHAYGQSSLGPFFLTFLGLATLFFIGLVIWRLPLLRGGEEIETFWSRENWVLITNLLFVGSVVAIMFGTTYPLFSELIGGRKVELGKDFYNQVDGPFLLATIAVLGICPILAWRRSAGETLRRGLLVPTALSVVVGVALALLGVTQPVPLLAFVICAFVIFSHLNDWVLTTVARRRSLGVNPAAAFAGMFWGNRPRYGAHVVHLSMAVIAIGVVGSSFFVSTVEGNLKVGETLQVAGYTLRYEGMSEDATPSREVVSATLAVQHEGASLGLLRPEMIFHKTFEQPVSEVAIHTTAREDLYVILAGWTADGTASFKVLVNPLIVWIWVGGVLMLMGGVVAMWPQASRRPFEASDATREPAPSAA
ncbi:MAG: heme lyase CcmF/NrfE family subunit [Chloroflexota bacterium]